MEINIKVAQIVIDGEGDDESESKDALMPPSTRRPMGGLKRGVSEMASWNNLLIALNVVVVRVLDIRKGPVELLFRLRMIGSMEFMD